MKSQKNIKRKIRKRTRKRNKKNIMGGSNSKNIEKKIFNNCSKTWYGFEINRNKKKYHTYINKLLRVAQKLLPCGIPSGEIKAVLTPHAGIGSSGLCAASAYCSLLGSNNHIKRVIILSTFHSGRDGIFIPDIHSFYNCGRKLKMDSEAVQFLKNQSNPNIRIIPVSNKKKIGTQSETQSGILDEMINEHSIEMQLPFLQNVLNYKKVKFLPIFVGKIAKKDIKIIANIIEEVGNKEKNNDSLWVINTDFLHIDTAKGNHYKNKIPNRNITNEIARIVSSFSLEVLNVTPTSYDNISATNKKYKNPRPAICGLNALKLWCKTDLAQQLYGTISSYYTSYHNNLKHMKLDYLTNLQLTSTPNLSHPFYADITNSFPKYTTNTSSVSYLSAIYTSHKYITSRPLSELLSQYEKASLIALSRRVLENEIFKMGIVTEKLLPVLSPNYLIKKGVFVTLKTNKKLRGCKGTTKQNNHILKNVIEFTKDSAFNDNRFRDSPITKEDMLHMTYDINILDKEYLFAKGKNKNLDEWNMGTDGIIVKKPPTNSAIYLPKVPIENKWGKEETLQHLSQKAGLNKNDWKNKNVEIWTIPGHEFGISII